MEELHLVLHKVKGRPAIDVAQRCLLSCGRELWWVPPQGIACIPTSAFGWMRALPLARSYSKERSGSACRITTPTLSNASRW